MYNTKTFFEHPPYRTDVALCDLFPQVKIKLQEMLFSRLENFCELGTTNVLYALVKFGKAGFRIGFGGWRGEWNVAEIT